MNVKTRVFHETRLSTLQWSKRPQKIFLPISVFSRSSGDTYFLTILINHPSKDQRFSRKYPKKRSIFKTKYPVILIRGSKRPSFQGHLFIDCGSLSESWLLTLNLQETPCKKQIDHLSTMNGILKRSLCHIMPI